MAKQPEIETILTGYDEKHKLNKNFKAIKEKFDEMLSRTPSTAVPNFMNVDLNVSDANITNVLNIQIEALQVVDVPLINLSDFYIYKLAQLDCDTEGDILTHDEEGDPICLPIGDEGEVLKSGSSTLVWSEDIDTDTDTVGVTVQENGVTVAENVTNIDFLFTGGNLITTPAPNQVDLELGLLFNALWEDTTQDSTNLNPDNTSSVVFGNLADINRLSLSSIGVAVPTSDNQYYVVAEASERLENSGTAAPGTYNLAVRFYDATGNATPLTGVQIAAPALEDDEQLTLTAGGVLHTLFCGVPAGTAYIDFGWLTAPLVPAALTYAALTDRYRALIPAALRDSFSTPQGHGYPGGINPTVSPPGP